ncbi:hypothetical protein NS226_09425 [Aureimonas ureilytica]|uniref:Uncharacterized protein n=1 Tax=Aureimonas ureilytica TaxID=401562 RepID=A0A175RBB7_9HYPH|nr:hypothetical protein NS226_09425 [Aureimonas ureilytica]
MRRKRGEGHPRPARPRARPRQAIAAPRPRPVRKRGGATRKDPPQAPSRRCGMSPSSRAFPP